MTVKRGVTPVSLLDRHFLISLYVKGLRSRDVAHVANQYIKNFAAQSMTAPGYPREFLFKRTQVEALIKNVKTDPQIIESRRRNKHEYKHRNGMETRAAILVLKRFGKTQGDAAYIMKRDGFLFRLRAARKGNMYDSFFEVY